ncbi:MAG: S8 family serine peptidase, partial [Candidatus Kapaibacterium sp.]
KVRYQFPYDEGGHGSNVAGVISAAHDYGPGVSGLAHGSRIMTLRAFDVSGNAEEDDIASAMLYAVENGARIVNASFGDGTYSALLRDASRYAYHRGVLIVASSGNSGGSDAHYPSDFPWMMSVGASSSRDVKTVFSSFNSQLSLVAPGQGMQTTDVGTGYVSVSGTSFSAPIVSSAAALLLQTQPDLTAAGIRQILERTAVPLDTSRWSRSTGAGRIDILAALESTGQGACFIERPALEETVRRFADSSLDVIAVVSDPLMKEWAVELGEGMNAGQWIPVGKGTSAVIRPSHIASVPWSQVPRDTTYTLRLRLTLSNGREIHRSTRFRVLNRSLAILSVTVEPVWVGAIRHAGIRVRTDRPVTAVARTDDQVPQRSVSDDRVGMSHYLTLDLTGTQSAGRRVVVTVTDADGDTASAWTTLPEVQDAISDTLLQRREWQTPRLFLNPQSVGTSRRTFVATDVSVATRTLRSFDRLWDTSNPLLVVRAVDSLNVPWFSRGFGDVDGDGVPELLTYSGGDTRVLRMSSDGRFGDVMFGDTLSHDFWASRFIDVDRDGRADIVGYRTSRTFKDSSGALRPRSDAIEVWSYRSGSFVRIGIHEPTSAPVSDKAVNTFSSPGAAVGDFDGDERVEIAYADSDGDVHVCEWTGSGLGTDAVLENGEDAEAGSEFTTETDVDGDGIPEILCGYPASTSRSADGEQAPGVWTFHLLKYDKDSSRQYREIWRDRFFGVRYGRPYYNGVAAGRLDAARGDEFVLSLFPNLYVFHYDTARKVVRPMWYADGAWSNSAMMTDMDGKGFSELVFTSQKTLKTEWWEHPDGDALPPPSGYHTRRIMFDSLRIAWIPVAGAGEYRVDLRRTEADGSTTRSLFNVVRPFFDINLPEGARADFAVASWRERQQSELFGPTQQLVAARDAILLSATFDGKTEGVMMCAFSSSVLHAGLHTGSFSVRTSSGRTLPVLSVVMVTDSLLAMRVSGALRGRDTLELSVRPEYADNTFPAVRGTVISIVPETDLDGSDLFFTRVVAFSSQSVTAEWSEEVTASALDPAAYLAPEQTEIRSIRFADSTRRRVVFDFDPQRSLGTRGFVYTLVAKGGIEAVSGRRIVVGTGNTVSWVHAADKSSTVFAFPQPCRLSEMDMIRFAGIPRGARVIILSTDGAEVASARERDDDGGVRWDFSTLDGKRIGAGVSLYAVVHEDGSVSDTFTFILEP